MATSPAPGGSTRPVPSPAFDRGRLLVAFGAFAVTLVLAGTTSALWPRTYRASARFVLDGGARVADPTRLADKLEVALLERSELAPLASAFPQNAKTQEEALGRLRSGIGVRSEGALGYVIECRGGRPEELQKITNRLADRAVALLPRVTATPPEERAAEKELALRTQALTSFLAAHPEITLEQANGAPPKPKSGAGDAALDLLRNERISTEIRLAQLEKSGSDNPYRDADEDPGSLRRRLTEVKNTIAAREAALRRAAGGESPPPISPVLQSEWRKLLAQLTEAQTKAATSPVTPPVAGHVAARAELPSTPIAPSRWLLAVASLLVSLAAGMIGYVIGQRPKLQPPARPRAGAGAEPPRAGRSDPPARGRSDPPPGGAIAPMAVQKIGGGATLHGTGIPPAPLPQKLESEPPARPGPRANGAISSNPPAALSSRPPPGAGTYSLSAAQQAAAAEPTPARNVVERLSPLATAHPPTGGRRSTPPGNNAPIVSRPPALDPDAEAWARNFESPPPAAPEGRAEGRKEGRSPGRWKTQMMGSMVPLEVSAARDESRFEDSQPAAATTTQLQRRSSPPPDAQGPAIVVQDVRSGWQPPAALQAPATLLAARDAILQQAMVRKLVIVVTGPATPSGLKASVACALALALADVRSRRVLLIEADFDQPELGNLLLGSEQPIAAGFSQQIMGRVQGLVQRPWSLVRCSPTLHVLPEGRLRSPGLLLSQEFENALLELRRAYDILVVNGPPVSMHADLRALDSLADAGLLAVPKGAPPLVFDSQPLRKLL